MSRTSTACPPPSRRAAEGDPPALGRRLDRVADEVVEGLPQLRGIDDGDSRPGSLHLDSDPAGLGARACPSRDVAHERAEVHGLRREARRPRVLEELLHDPVDPLRLGGHDPEKILKLLPLGAARRCRSQELALQALGRHADRVQRVADLVGHGGSELAHGREAVATAQRLLRARVLLAEDAVAAAQPGEAEGERHQRPRRRHRRHEAGEHALFDPPHVVEAHPQAQARRLAAGEGHVARELEHRPALHDERPLARGGRGIRRLVAEGDPPVRVLEDRVRDLGAPGGDLFQE